MTEDVPSELCHNGVQLRTRVCSYGGVSDDEVHEELVSKESLSMLLDLGIRCHHLFVFWDKSGVFYLGEPVALKAKYGMSPEEITQYSTEELEDIASKSKLPRDNPPGNLSVPDPRDSPRRAGAFALKLGGLIALLIRLRGVSPVNLQLLGEGSPKHQERLATLSAALADKPLGGRVAIMTSSPQEAEGLLGRGVEKNIVLSAAVPLSGFNMSEHLPTDYQNQVAYLVPSILQWTNASQRSQLRATGLPVATTGSDFDSFRSWKSVLGVDAPACLFSSTPLTLHEHLKAQCSVGFDQHSAPSEREDEFFVKWTTQL